MPVPVVGLCICVIKTLLFHRESSQMSRPVLLCFVLRGFMTSVASLLFLVKSRKFLRMPSVKGKLPCNKQHLVL